MIKNEYGDEPSQRNPLSGTRSRTIAGQKYEVLEIKADCFKVRVGFMEHLV